MKAEEQVPYVLKGLHQSEMHATCTYLNERVDVPPHGSLVKFHPFSIFYGHPYVLSLTKKPCPPRVMKGITCTSEPQAITLFLTHFPKSNRLHCFLRERGNGHRLRGCVSLSRSLPLERLSRTRSSPHERRRRRSSPIRMRPLSLGFPPSSLATSGSVAAAGSLCLGIVG